MAYVWDFVKRNRNKILFSTAAVGALYIGKKCYEKCQASLMPSSANNDLNAQLSRLIVESDLGDGFSHLAQSTSLDDSSIDDVQVRKMYIFESNQKACENTLLDLAPSLKDRLHQLTHLDLLLKKLHRADCTEQEKLEIWQEIKVFSIARIMTTIFSLSLLVLSMKIQLSIVAADLMLKSENKLHKSDRTTSWFGLGSMMDKIFQQNGIKSKQSEGGEKASAQQVFLQAISYFISQGCERLHEKIFKVTRSLIDHISLKEPYTESSLRYLFEQIKSKIWGNRYAASFSQYVTPVPAGKNFFDGFDENDGRDELAQLLNAWKSSMENSKFLDVFDSYVDQLIGMVLDFVRVNRPEWQLLSSDIETEGCCDVPLAKLVPVVSDAFTFLTDTGLKTAISRLTDSQNARQYCMEIFEVYTGCY